MNGFFGTRNELLFSIQNEQQPLEEYQKEQQIQQHIRTEACKYKNLPKTEWPTLSFNWNLSPEFWHKSFDGDSQSDVNSKYPEGLLLGLTDLISFDDYLHTNSKRNDTELWDFGCESKLAEMIAYLHRHYPISPVAVTIVEEKIVIMGGNHRYTVAKFSSQSNFYFICSSNDKNALDSIINIQWK